MNILIQVLIFLCAVKTLSYFKWCLKHDKGNIIGNISVLCLCLALLATNVIIYTRVN